MVVNSEQRFGLSQATAALACGRSATLTCFATNRAASCGSRRVPYDPDCTHETVLFQRLLAEALRLEAGPSFSPPSRPRMSPAAGKPVVGLGGLQSASRAFSEEEWTRFIRAGLGEKPFG